MAVDREVRRLNEVIRCQQRELVQLRAGAQAELVMAQARGVLSERLGCDGLWAAEHLAALARRAGVSQLELAAEVLGGQPGSAQLGGAQAGVRLRLAEAGLLSVEHGTGMAATVFTEVLAPLGATALGIWALRPDGALHLVGQHGLGPAEASRWHHLPPQLDSSHQLAVRTGRALWLDRTVLPLQTGRRTLGVLEVRWPEGRTPQPGLRGELVALAELCAGTLAMATEDGTDPGGPEFALLDQLLDLVLIAHAQRGEDGQVADFVVDHVSAGFVDSEGRGADQLVGSSLLASYPHLAVAGGLFDSAVQVLATGQAQRLDGHALTDGSVVDVRIARLFDGVAVTWRPGDRQADLLAHAQRLARVGGWRQDLATGEVRWTAEMAELLDTSRPRPLNEVAEHDVQALDRLFNAAIAQRRAATAVLRRSGADGTVRHLRVFAEPALGAAGEVAAVHGAVQDVTAQYHPEYVLSATEDQLTEQRRLALRLQHAIIPPSPHRIQVDSVEVAVRYRPAGHEHLVGGDWYDVVRLPDGRVLLVVGDMAGHGIGVVTGMISMRNALRGLAVTGESPARLLHWLNIAAQELSERVNGTVVCGRYDPDTGELLWARAGHLPPLLIRDGACTVLPLPRGAMLGAFTESVYEETSTPLREGDVLVMYTDGLVERPGADLDESIDQLAATAGRTVGDIERYADDLLDHADLNTRDDTCLLALRIG
ncbi:PP2C family protein-serine/threonine phosphatase [Kutzneria albida]|uniref:PAC domain-containing protein n=1 Tax=Kutzneria albida DSM 43870 TaxID=1449976 RepID=W5WBT8_9PSEU|nr:PP2C family protein-serine/threonine phosphatase [Kutzneria albida]AHH98016.1 hypothetical protein KALB_4654 [Kutzneria albida DSM 43870]